MERGQPFLHRIGEAGARLGTRPPRSKRVRLAIQLGVAVLVFGFLVLTVVGHAAAPERLIKRSGAQPGDVLVVTGELGGAAAGLLLLDKLRDFAFIRDMGGSTSKSALDRREGERVGLVARQLEPRPRLAAGRALAGAGATAMIDLSDGLGGDANHLAAASGVELRIDGDALPLAAGLAEVATAAGRDPIELAVSGGEDYELLVALPTERLEEARRAVSESEGIALTRIGEVAAGDGVEIRLQPDGRRLEPEGFDQLG